MNNIPPDLVVYFGDLDWRSVGSVGGGADVHTFENDTGPDDANHDWDGVAILRRAGEKEGRALEGMSLLDVAPTILGEFGLKIPPEMGGKLWR